MLLNLSNHPSTSWDSHQIQTAIEQFGQVVDMPFPHIAPEATKEEIQHLAHQYAQDILATYPTHSLTIHLMGELCFTFALLKLLQEKGIKVVASTTERVVTEMDHQQKVVSFKFVKFREYT